MPTPLNRLRLWQDPNGEAPVCRIAIAGDFLPAMGLSVPDRDVWRDMAGKVAAHFEDVSVTFVNLETPLDVDGLDPKPKMGLGQNLGAPKESLEYLRTIRAYVVGCANNHIYDYGIEGVKRTKAALQAMQMESPGVGRCLTDPPEIAVWKGPGQVKVGFWAASNNSSEPASTKSKGVEVLTLGRAGEALAEMDRQHVTCRIALLHAGLERTNRPDPEDVRLMNSLTAAGFDLVAACHSHRISGYAPIARGALERPAFCFYGLGNLSSGCIYSCLEREGLIVVVGLDSQSVITEIEVKPVFLESEGWGSVPFQEQGDRILKRFADLSAEIADGSYERLFYADMAKGLFLTQFRDALVAYQQGGIRGLGQKVKRFRMKHLRRVLYKVLS